MVFLYVMKVLVLNLFILLFQSQLAWAEPDYNADDFTFDPTTSTLVPKFMGKIMLIRGQVSAESESGKRKLSKGDKIFKQDTVKTGKRGIVKIELVDQTIITLNTNSEFNVSTWNYVPQKGERDAIINLLRGQMRTHFKVKAQKRNKLEVKVNNIAMGVRGTKILANANTDKAGREVTQIALIEGYGRLYDGNNEYQANMKKGDHYISVIGPDASKTKLEKIPSREVKKLLAAGKNPKKNFFPFLGNYDIKKIGIHKAKKANSGSGNPGSSKGKGPKEDAWKGKLKELNKRLDEYND